MRLAKQINGSQDRNEDAPYLTCLLRREVDLSYFFGQESHSSKYRASFGAEGKWQCIADQGPG